MPRSAATSIENNFTMGLITEVTGVNSPENSVSESINTIFDRKGRAVKRGAFVYEDGHVLNDYAGIVGAQSVYETFLWESVAGSGSIKFLVVQVGSRLDFYQISSETALSSSKKSFFVDLLTYKKAVFSDTVVKSTPCSFTYGKGYLFVANTYCETFYVKYDEQTDTITTSQINIRIRDFEGVEDGLELEQNPTTLATLHKYNLYNQGWTDTYISSYFSALSNYPSNSMVWWYLLDTNSSGAEVFQPSTIKTIKPLYGNTPAPKGHFILDPFNTNRSTLVGSTVDESTSNGYRPSIVAFSWGRAFYAGVPGSGYSSSIYFSKIIESDDDLGTCYQSADPTSRENFAIVDSDGGVIKIQNIAQIIDLKASGDAMFVFATNGVWAITGTDNGAFKATDYSVSKISSYPAISRSSVVDVGGIPIWWNYEGIFMLQQQDAGFTKTITNVTQSTIQTAYDDIPPTSKFTAKGVYNDQSGLIYWLYNADIDNDDPTAFTNVLVLDVVTTGFYILTLPDTADKQVKSLVATRASGELTITENVIDSLDSLVTNSIGQPVTVDISYGFTTSDKLFKFLVLEDNRYITLAEIDESGLLDWGDTNYDSYFITGYRIRGDLLNKSQTNYVAVITEETGMEQSCYLQGIWDYANDHDSGRYTNPQQVYRTTVLRDYLRSKLKIRGNGYSLQFKFYGESGKAFSVIGWAAFETANQVP